MARSEEMVGQSEGDCVVGKSPGKGGPLERDKKSGEID